MKKIDTLCSVSGKELGAVFQSGNLFSFEHFVADQSQGGFSTASEALDALHAFHDEWFENQ